MFFIYLLIFYLVTNVAGLLIEKIRIPKIYAALFLGVLLSTTPKVLEIVSLDASRLLSQVGMFSLLFLLGFGLEISKIKQQSNLIVKVTAFVILSEFIIGLLILHFFFHVPWILSGIIAVSFATVGEVALLPLLKEFKILNTNLGQTILGVAILDDTVEILAFILLLIFVSGLNYSDLFYEVLPLIAIFLGAIFKNIINSPKKFDEIITFIALWIFGPIFFFTAGTEADLNVLINNFLVILLITVVINITKISSAYISSHKQLGTKKSIVVGVSLAVKFSTSVVILIMLLQKNLITHELFSILIETQVMFKIIVPIVLSILLSKWKLDLVEAKNENLAV